MTPTPEHLLPVPLRHLTREHQAGIANRGSSVAPRGGRNLAGDVHRWRRHGRRDASRVSVMQTLWVLELARRMLSGPRVGQ